MKITLLDADTLHRQDIDFSSLEKLGETTYFGKTSPAETSARMEGAEVIITNKVVLTKDHLANAPTLKLICIAATGTNCVDLEAARELGIPVCNVSGYSTPGVAQHTFALLLTLVTSLHRYLPEAQEWPSSPLFTRLDHPVIELSGKTFGVIGYGSIGQAAAEVAKSLGMKVVALARQGSSSDEVTRLEKNEFFAQSDVISLHCPLTDETKEIINAETLAFCKPTAILLNTGRGPLIDEAALADALRNQKIAGAGLDVLSTEPPSPDNPLMASDLPNLLITPHTAWASQQSRQRLLDGIVANITAFLEGEERNRVA